MSVSSTLERSTGIRTRRPSPRFLRSKVGFVVRRCRWDSSFERPFVSRARTGVAGRAQGPGLARGKKVCIPAKNFIVSDESSFSCEFAKKVLS